jgi:hypothetical protein
VIAPQQRENSAFTWNDLVLFASSVPALAVATYWAFVSDAASDPQKRGMTIAGLIIVIGVFGALVFFVRGTYAQRSLTKMQFLVTLTTLFAVLFTVIEGFTICFRQTGVCDNAGVEHRDALTCFYFATTTWTTIGFGDVVPTAGARKVVIAEAFISYAMTGLFLAVLVRAASIVKP